MTNWMKYGEIQKNKKLGFSRTQVSKMLGLDKKTVAKYWDMDLEEYSKMLDDSKERIKKAMKYKNEILDWLQRYPDMTSAQIYDWLEEKHKSLDFAERTLRLFVADLRDEYKIFKGVSHRQYNAVDDPPMGYQAQVDMGEIWLTTDKNTRVKLYCFAMVLSHSRYKYVYWTDRPFNAMTFINAHNKAFDFFGGRTVEIVYDQDKVLAVSENHGDIIYTELFQKYLDTIKFKVYLCRGNDPESKGRIESVVKYAKYNFASHRIFVGLSEFNDDCIKWLERRGNGKVHETTKKVPAEVFALEKQHLLPVPVYGTKPNKSILSYIVRKDNTVLYRQNRYRVPVGTYEPGKKVGLEIDDDKLTISDVETKQVYAVHRICTSKGELVALKHADRDMSANIGALYNNVLDNLNNSNKARVFLDGIRKDKPRYFRDQLNLILKTTKKVQEANIVQKAIDYCVTSSLWSASEYVTAVKYFEEIANAIIKPDTTTSVSIPAKYKGMTPDTRDINEYAKLVSSYGDNKKMNMIPK